MSLASHDTPLRHSLVAGKWTSPRLRLLETWQEKRHGKGLVSQETTIQATKEGALAWQSNSKQANGSQARRIWAKAALGFGHCRSSRDRLPLLAALAEAPAASPQARTATPTCRPQQQRGRSGQRLTGADPGLGDPKEESIGSSACFTTNQLLEPSADMLATLADELNTVTNEDTP